MPLDPAQCHQIEQDAITAAWEAATTRLGSGIEGARAADRIVRSGLIGEAVRQMHSGKPNAVAFLVFRMAEFGELKEVDPSGQIVATIARKLDIGSEQPLVASPPQKNEESAMIEAFSDTVRSALQNAVDKIKLRNHAREPHVSTAE